MSSGAAGVSSDFTLKVGALVEICKDTRALLALLERPDGKRNWFAKDVRYVNIPAQLPMAPHDLFPKVHGPWLHGWQCSSCCRESKTARAVLQGVASKLCDPCCRGHSHSVTPKQISYVLPGAPYEEADLLSIHEQTQAEADSALMALAWEVRHAPSQPRSAAHDVTHTACCSMLHNELKQPHSSPIRSSRQTLAMIHRTDECTTPVPLFMMYKSSTEFQPVPRTAPEHVGLTLLPALQMSADEPDALLSVPQMAQLLYARSDPVACYASHRLLNEDRVYFRQVGRAPPTFQPRAQRDVDSLLAKQQAEQRVRGPCAWALIVGRQHPGDDGGPA